MLNGGQGNERVVHRTACHSGFTEHLRKAARNPRSDEQRWREALVDQASRVAWG